MTGLLTQTTATSEPPVPRRRRPGSGLWTAIRTNPKALAGLVIFVLFCVVAIAPGLFTPVRSPNALSFAPSLHPSASHPLGTTTLGQDIFAQLVYGTRQSLVIALVAGFFATILSVLVGVSAAYLGGVADESLSMITN